MSDISFFDIDEMNQFYAVCQEKYKQDFEQLPFRIKKVKETGKSYRVFKTSEKKEIDDYALYGTVEPHEKASVSYVVPNHPYSTDQEGDIIVYVRAEDEHTTTSSKGFSRVVDPSTSIAIHKVVNGKDVILGQVSYPAYIDVSDRHKVAALLNGLYGKPEHAKDFPQVMEYFSNFVHRENDLSWLKKYVKSDVALVEVKRKQRKKLRAEIDAKNMELQARLERENPEKKPQTQDRGNVFDRIRDRIKSKVNS